MSWCSIYNSKLLRANGHMFLCIYCNILVCMIVHVHLHLRAATPRPYVNWILPLRTTQILVLFWAVAMLFSSPHMHSLRWTLRFAVKLNQHIYVEKQLIRIRPICPGVGPKINRTWEDQGAHKTRRWHDEIRLVTESLRAKLPQAVDLSAAQIIVDPLYSMDDFCCHISIIPLHHLAIGISPFCIGEIDKVDKIR